MTSLQVKEIGAMMSSAIASSAGTTNQSAGSVSFESVWNNQTEKQNMQEMTTKESETVQKEDNSFVRDSLKSKDARKNAVKQSDATGELQKDDLGNMDLRNMDPKEWEKAMEVLGAAAVEMIQQIANAFDMTVEEVQGLMSDLDMEQLDVLQQDALSELILAAGGADDATALLTDEGLYQQYQVLVGQLSGILEESSETLQLDAEQLVEMAVESTEDAMSETPLIQITVVEQSDNLEQGSGQPEAEGAEAEETDAKQSTVDNKGQSENLLIQNMKTESFEPQLQQLSESVPTWDSDTIDVMKQIMDYMKIQVKPDSSSLEMQLHPANLGTLQIHMSSKGGMVTAQFVTQNEVVKAALESQMIQLKESFAEQGVKVDAVEVTVQTHQFEQNLEQGQNRQQEEPDRRTRTRRIRLDGALAMDDFSEMEADEQLAAEMLVANGNTVDYTA